MGIMSVTSACGDQRACHIPWNRVTVHCVAHCLLESLPQYSQREASALKCWAISPALCLNNFSGLVGFHNRIQWKWFLINLTWFFIWLYLRLLFWYFLFHPTILFSLFFLKSCYPQGKQMVPYIVCLSLSVFEGRLGSRTYIKYYDSQSLFLGNSNEKRSTCSE